MAIIFHCEHCGKKIEAADTAGGKWGKCPACHNRLYVPASESEEELKLAPLDETDLERKQRLLAEANRLTQDILQEREIPEGITEPSEPVGATGPIFEMGQRELTNYIVKYIRLMADSELYEAERVAGFIAPHKAQALKILDKIALSEIPEPELADISQLVISGSIRALRDEIT